MLSLPAALLGGPCCVDRQSGDRLRRSGLSVRRQYLVVGCCNRSGGADFNHGCQTGATVVTTNISTPTVLAVAIVGAYAAYEVVLFAFTPALGGAGAFTLAVVARLGTLNLLWLIGLVTACEVFRLLNPIRRHQAVS